MLDNSSTSVIITKLPPNVIRLSFVPQNRGRHELVIQLQNTNICGNPIPSFVYVDPEQISSRKPERTSIAEVAPIKCYDNNVYVTSVGTEIIVLEQKKSYLVLGKAVAQGSLSSTRRIPLSGAGEPLIWGQYIYNSNIYTHKVEKVSMDGRILASIDGKGSLSPRSFNFPNGIRINKHNEIYVCDTNNHQIQVLDTDLNPLRVIGHVGIAPRMFKSPYDLVFDEDDNIYVVENKNNRVQVLTPQGGHIRFIGTSGTNSLILPCSASIHNGHIYITNRGRKCISVFTLTGTFVTSFGEKDHFPECIDIDKDGYIYVTSDRKNILKY